MDTTKYIVRQPGKADREFNNSREAVQQMLKDPGYAEVFADNELVMSKGFPRRN